MNKGTNSSDPKRVVQRGYDQVAHDYARLEGETDPADEAVNEALRLVMRIAEVPTKYSAESAES